MKLKPIDTTRAAFRASRASQRTHRDRVLERLTELGNRGATGWELGERLGILYPVAAATCSKLAAADEIHDSGRRRIATKHEATVWVIGPRPKDSELPARDSAAKLKKQLSDLRTHVAAMHGTLHDCWNCGAQIEVEIARLEAILEGEELEPNVDPREED